MHFQNALLTLPLPKLEDTIPRYLRSQRPLLRDDDYSRTEKLANDYLNGQGKGWFEIVAIESYISLHFFLTAALRIIELVMCPVIVRASVSADDHKALMEKWQTDKQNGTSYITGNNKQAVRNN